MDTFLTYYHFVILTIRIAVAEMVYYPTFLPFKAIVCHPVRFSQGRGAFC